MVVVVVAAVIVAVAVVIVVVVIVSGGAPLLLSLLRVLLLFSFACIPLLGCAASVGCNMRKCEGGCNQGCTFREAWNGNVW